MICFFLCFILDHHPLQESTAYVHYVFADKLFTIIKGHCIVLAVRVRYYVMSRGNTLLHLALSERGPSMKYHGASVEQHMLQCDRARLGTL